MVSGIMWYRYLKKNNDRREALESKGAFDVSNEARRTRC